MSTRLRCAGCQNPLPKKEHLSCMFCKATYDIVCANISQKLFNIMERKDKWKCPECICKKPKTGNVNTPVRSGSTSTEEHEPTMVALRTEYDDNITRRTNIVRPPVNIEMENTSSMNDSSDNPIVSELKIFMEELIKTSVGSIQTAITELMHALNAQNKRIDLLESRILALENKIESPNDITALESTISQLQADINDRDQALLSSEMEITGCPETINENCTHIALTVAKKIGVELEERDIASAERVGPVRRPAPDSGAAARPRPIAVRLTRRTSRDAVLRAARVRRGLDTDGLQLAGPARRLYLNERLTKLNRVIFLRARELAREMNYKFVWTREGKIFVRREPGTVKHRLRLETDLLKVFGKIHI